MSGICAEAGIDWSKIDLEKKKETPVLLYHGQEDSTIPIEFAQLTFTQLLKSRGLDHYNFVVEKGMDHDMESEDQS